MPDQDDARRYAARTELGGRTSALPLSRWREGVVDLGLDPKGPVNDVAVHGDIRQGVGIPVLLSRDPGELHRSAGVADVADNLLRLQGQPPHVFVLDPPATGHLLDHEFGIHSDADRGARVNPRGGLKAGDETAVFGDIVRGQAQGLGAFGQQSSGLAVPHQCAIPSDSRVAT